MRRFAFDEFRVKLRLDRHLNVNLCIIISGSSIDSYYHGQCDRSYSCYSIVKIVSDWVIIFLYTVYLWEQARNKGVV